jgi:hypothetical protein
MVLNRLLTVIANLFPLAGVLWWGWDVFEILVLFWMQTVLVIALAVPHIAKLPNGALGEITVNGVTRPATRRDMMLGVGLIGLAICAAYLLFLWVIFAGHWRDVIHGPRDFVQHLIIQNGAWTALATIILVEMLRYLLTPPRGTLIERVVALVGLRLEASNHEDLGSILLKLLKRAFLLQAAIIFGGMLVRSYDSMAALLILVGLKTLVELATTKPLRPSANGEARTR